jgi:hypothetical protein
MWKLQMNTIYLFLAAGGFAIAALLLKRFRVNNAGTTSARTQDGVSTAVNYHRYEIPAFMRKVLPHINGANFVKHTNHSSHLITAINEKIGVAEKAIEQQRKLISSLTIDKTKIATGMAGEQAVADFIKRALDNRWTVIEGFKGGKGEVDFVLVGPLGVFAIEVKNRNGVVCCNGDKWSLKKPNGESVALADNGGRSPSQQINEAATWLESELREVGYDVRIQKAVILAHPKACLGAIVNLSVDSLMLLSAPGNFKKYLSLGTPLSAEQISGIVLVLRYG